MVPSAVLLARLCPRGLAGTAVDRARKTSSHRDYGTTGPADVNRGRDDESSYRANDSKSSKSSRDPPQRSVRRVVVAIATLDDAMEERGVPRVLDLPVILAIPAHAGADHGHR